MLSEDPQLLEAWVESSMTGKRLNEYKINHHPAVDGKDYPYTECFLETTDEPFAIHLRMKDKRLFDSREWRAKCCVDGRKLGSSWDSPSRVFSRIIQEEDGKLLESKLKFSPLPTTDEEQQVSIDSKTLQALGTITIQIQSGKWIPNTNKRKNWSKLVSGVAHEKSKKIPYVVQACDTKIAPETPKICYNFHPDKKGSAFYRFVFNYRPRPVLQLIGAINENELPEIPSQKRKSPITGDGTTSKQVKLEKIKVERSKR
ncbi:uncharacterized protein L201_002827 [Kwoniella dendrophila CBS 6074]|uniref:DUF7918 domain-containing protein n=1 Tax=Kwoniella dendrophila CBS 6074 TaxID=1295534 RepID=A0AAX4JTJ2_9TREE